MWVQRLQDALNAPSQQPLKALLPAGDEGWGIQGAGEGRSRLLERHQEFQRRFPDARWTVSSAPALPDGRSTVLIAVSGTREEGPIRYRMNATQRLAIRLQGYRLLEQEVIAGESLMRSGSGPLPVTVSIPGTVLTGSRYDVDVVFEMPLDGALVAGGLVNLSEEQWLGQAQPEIELGPLGGGGLFKSVRAPLNEGLQNWAALLVHPDGIVTVSKRVRVVNERRELVP